MVVAGGDYVHFVVEYGGKIEKCRVTETALLNRERMKGRRLCTAHRYLCKAPSRDRTSGSREVAAGGAQAPMQSALEQCRPDRDPSVTRPEAIRGMIDAMLHILAKQPGEKPTKKAKGK